MFYFSWTSKELAAVVGVPIDTLNRRINFWISKVMSLYVIHLGLCILVSGYLCSKPIVVLSMYHI